MNKFKTITITKSESVRQEEQIILKDKDAEIVWKLAKRLNELRRGDEQE